MTSDENKYAKCKNPRVFAGWQRLFGTENIFCFAVVAEEVRNLAQRSAEAASDTSAKIQMAQQNSEQGYSSSEEVAKGLEEIAQKVNRVHELIADVAAGSTEQTKGTEQLNINDIKIE